MAVENLQWVAGREREFVIREGRREAGLFLRLDEALKVRAVLGLRESGNG